MGGVRKLILLFVVAAIAVAGFMMFNGTTGSATAPPVTATIILSGCDECWKTDAFLANIKQDKVVIERTLSLEPNSTEALQLIEKYNITKLPTVIFSSRLADYANVVPRWMVIGSKEKDGSFVLRTPNPPFVEMPSGRVRGIVELVEIVDAGCTGCYDVSQQKAALAQQFGITFGEVARYDIVSQGGRELIAKYNITAVPTVLLSSESEVYPMLTSVWSQIGTFESDGWLVFRKMQAASGAVWKDLLTNETHSSTA
jgi:hypothetical protein